MKGLIRFAPWMRMLPIALLIVAILVAGRANYKW